MKLPMHFLYCYGYFAATVAWVMFAAPFHAPARALMRRMATSTGWGGLKTALPQCRLAEFTTFAEPVRVDNTIDHAFNTSFYELFALSQLVADRKPQQVFEFGTFNGRTTLHLAVNTPASTQVTTMDLPESESPFEDHSVVGECFRGTAYEGKIKQLYANTRHCDLSAYAGCMNFIFIDASHEYADVQHDTELAIQLACPENCVIVWHDYSQWPGVQRALDDRFVKGGIYAGLRQIRGTTMAVLTLGSQGHETRERQQTRPTSSRSAPSPSGAESEASSRSTG